MFDDGFTGSGGDGRIDLVLAALGKLEIVV